MGIFIDCYMFVKAMFKIISHKDNGNLMYKIKKHLLRLKDASKKESRSTSNDRVIYWKTNSNNSPKALL